VNETRSFADCPSLVQVTVICSDPWMGPSTEPQGSRWTPEGPIKKGPETWTWLCESFADNLHEAPSSDVTVKLPFPGDLEGPVPVRVTVNRGEAGVVTAGAGVGAACVMVGAVVEAGVAAAVGTAV